MIDFEQESEVMFGLWKKREIKGSFRVDLIINTYIGHTRQYENRSQTNSSETLTNKYDW